MTSRDFRVAVWWVRLDCMGCSCCELEKEKLCQVVRMADSNPHGVNRWNLNPVRLPVPPHSQKPNCQILVVRPERLERPTLRFEA